MSLVINNNNITDIAIGNREIIRVSDANSVVLWEKPYTVTYVKSITEDYSDCLAWSQASAIDTGVQHSNVNMKFRLKFKTKCGPTSDIWLFSNRIIGYTQGDDICTSDNYDFRFFGFQGGSFDWGSYRAGNFGMLAADTECDITMGVDTNGNPYFYDNIGETYKALLSITAGTPPTLNCKIFVDVRWIEVEELIIYNAQDYIMFDGKAAYDSWGRIGLYDTVSNTMKYNSNLTMTYEDYQDTAFAIETINGTGSVTVPAGVKYSMDKTTWSDGASSTTLSNLAVGEKVYCKTVACDGSWTEGTRFDLPSGTQMKVSGKLGYLLYGDEVDGHTFTGSFFELFERCQGLVDASELDFNIDFSTNNSFKGTFEEMFAVDKNLTAPPTLPATNLSPACYRYMFDECIKLTTAPALPATVVPQSAYAFMFRSCTSLITAPSLPATTLGITCYYYMFSGCSSLTTAPATLPATTVPNGAYDSMFEYCTSLTLAPVIYATTFGTSLSCNHMFRNCSSLNNVTVYGYDNSNGQFASWLDGVAATGTFYNYSGVSIPTNSASGIPSGWTEIVGQCETPVCSFVDGIYGSGCNNYNGTAVMTINCATAGATIYYKIGSGNFETYSAPVTLTTGSQTITTYATKANYTDSNNGTYSHTVPADQGQCVSDPNFYCEALTPATIELPYNGRVSSAFKFSSDGINWTNTTNSNKTRTIQRGEKLYVRYNIPSIAITFATGIQINITSGIVKIGGKLSTLTNNGDTTDDVAVACLVGNVFAGQTRIVDASDLIVNVKSFNNSTRSTKAMFKNCSGLVYPPQLPLTLGTRSEYTGCYSEMFSGCTSLAYSPALPSTVVPEEGYKDMFTNCTALTTAGAISAITVGNSGMRNMFNNCTHLTAGPSLAFTSVGTQGCSQMFYSCQSMVTPPATLPATTLADSCYSYMFQNCYALTSAPSLPATTLAINCYSNMFAYCGNLTTAPDLPAISMAAYCYQAMFNQCSSLSSINVKITDWSEYNAAFWVSGVAQSGTFTKYGAATIPTGMNGIPTGWTVVDNGETPILAAPNITYDNNATECWDGSSALDGTGAAFASYNTIQNATFYMRYCAVGGDITQESWLETDNIYLPSDGDYIVQAKATKSGWTDSPITTITATVSGATECTEEPDPCQECLDACEGDPDCEAVCNECDQPCGEPCVVDCTDWENVGYESYEDCDCSENGNCPEEEEPEE